jgi:hypothetical protein
MNIAGSDDEGLLCMSNTKPSKGEASSNNASFIDSLNSTALADLDSPTSHSPPRALLPAEKIEVSQEDEGVATLIEGSMTAPQPCSEPSPKMFGPAPTSTSPTTSPIVPLPVSSPTVPIVCCDSAESEGGGKLHEMVRRCISTEGGANQDGDRGPIDEIRAWRKVCSAAEWEREFFSKDALQRIPLSVALACDHVALVNLLLELGAASSLFVRDVRGGRVGGVEGGDKGEREEGGRNEETWQEALVCSLPSRKLAEDLCATVDEQLKLHIEDLASGNISMAFVSEEKYQVSQCQ